KEPTGHYAATALALAKSKESSVVYFSLRHSGLFRWELPKTGKTTKRADANVSKNLASVEGANVRSMVQSSEGKILLVCYDSLPVFRPGIENPMFPGERLEPLFGVWVYRPFFEVWDTETGKPLLIVDSSRERRIYHGTMSADGKLLAIAGFIRSG